MGKSGFNDMKGTKGCLEKVPERKQSKESEEWRQCFKGSV